VLGVHPLENDPEIRRPLCPSALDVAPSMPAGFVETTRLLPVCGSSPRQTKGEVTEWVTGLFERTCMQAVENDNLSPLRGNFEATIAAIFRVVQERPGVTRHWKHGLALRGADLIWASGPSGLF